MHRPENNTAVAESVREALSPSIEQLNISEISMKRILHKDLGMTAYKVQLVQQLKPIDHPKRFRIAKWVCDRFTEDANLGKKKTSFQINLIFILADTKTNKIVAFGAQKTSMYTLKSRIE